MEHGGIQEIIASGCAPGLSGLNKGPGCGNRQRVWARPNPVKDMALDAKAMEDAGQMTPEVAGWAEGKIEAAKNQVHEKVDYDKHGHPLDGCDAPELLGNKDGSGVILGD